MALAILDLGATKFAAKLLSKQGEITDTFLLPKFNDFRKEIKHVLYFLKELLNKINDEVIQGCVCSTAASVDRFGKIYRWPNRPYWKGYDIGSALSNLFGVPILFEDDGHLAAYAESKLLSLPNLIYLGIGSGIAGGIVLNNHLIRGTRNKSAEFGHVSVDPNGIRCHCGRHGCVQTYASGIAILKNSYGNDWKNKSKTDILHDIERKQTNIIKALDSAAVILARALININETLDIDTIVIGGGFGSGFVYFHTRIKYFMDTLLRPGQLLPSILTARAGQHSSLKGAEFLMLDQIATKNNSIKQSSNTIQL